MTRSGTARSGGCCAFRISQDSGNLTACALSAAYGTAMPSALDRQRRRQQAHDTRLVTFLLSAYLGIIVFVFAR